MRYSDTEVAAYKVLFPVGSKIVLYFAIPKKSDPYAVQGKGTVTAVDASGVHVDVFEEGVGHYATALKPNKDRYSLEGEEGLVSYSSLRKAA